MNFLFGDMDACAESLLPVVGAEDLVLAQEALMMAIILFNQLRHVVLVLDELPGLVKRKLLETLDLGVSQRNTLRGQQLA